MKSFLSLIISLFYSCCFSQTAPTIAWQKLIGGINQESSYFTFNYNNGNFYLTSSSNSGISGDKTEENRGVNYDYWLVKTDENGSILWDKTMGAGPLVALGPDNDLVTSVYETSDGSLLVGGFSNSNISGEKTEASRGQYDYWLLKLESDGTVQWDKTLGGDGWDYPATFFELNDGNYMVAGTSGSSIAGDRTEVSRGDDDIWLLKMSPSGTVLWQKAIGGNSKDVFGKILQTPDNGFIIAGTSYSNVSGEKTENSYGLSDYWILKLDENGTIQWQKTIGGSHLDFASTIIETNDGGYLFGGKSSSPLSGLKTENNRGDYDYWLVKIDSFGNIEWQKTIGGNGEDALNSVYQCQDNGYIIVGTSSSSVSGDKTEDSKGYIDGWIVKLDENGVLQWQKDIGGDGNDGLAWVMQMPDASFVMGGGSTSSNSFDVTAINHNPGYSDIWLVKLNAEGLATDSFGGAEISFYPNPAKESITIDLGTYMDEITVLVSNVLGQKVSQETFININSFKIPIVGASGIYFVTLINMQGEKKILKVSKQ